MSHVDENGDCVYSRHERQIDARERLHSTSATATFSIRATLRTQNGVPESCENPQLARLHNKRFRTDVYTTVLSINRTIADTFLGGRTKTDTFCIYPNIVLPHNNPKRGLYRNKREKACVTRITPQSVIFVI